MRRFLHLIAAVLATLLIASVLRFSFLLPPDPQPLIEKKYSSWCGVLRGWICTRWHAGSDFIAWLNQCASSFEKKHRGVYLEFTSVTEQAINEISSDGLRPPELLFFSPGVLQSSAMLEDITPHPHKSLSSAKALPVCIGGYVWVINSDLCDSIPDSPVHLPDDPGRSFSSAAGGLKGTEKNISLPDPALDLGLPVSASPQANLESFINGKLPALIVSQYELAKLIRLRDAGRGPDWRCVPSGTYMHADQLLLGSLVAQEGSDASSRSSLAHAFLQFLLTDECQQKLMSIGAFPTTAVTAYPSASPYALLEGAIKALPWNVPPFF